jgi:hypothetical protein
MKPTLLVTFLLVFYLSLVAALGQTIPYTKQWGPPLKQEKRLNEYMGVIGSDQVGTYTLKYNSADNLLYIEQLNQELNVTSSYQLPLFEASGKRRWYEFSVYINNQIYVCSSYADKNTKKRKLYAQVFDKITGKLGSESLLTEIDFQGNWRANSGFFRYRLSMNEKRILIYAQLPFSDIEPEQFSLLVLDDQWNPLWNKQISLPYKDRLFEWESMQVSAEGDAYLLGVAYTDMRRNKRRGSPNYTYELFKYTKNTDRETHQTIGLSDKFITDMQIAVLDNNDVVCAGFYSDMGSFSNKGTYFIRLDSETNKITQNQFKEYSLDMITENLTERQTERMSKRAEKGKEIELPAYNLDRLIIDDTDGLILVGEEVSTREVTNKEESYIQYFYGEIFVVRISAKGEIQWTKKIPKRQVSQSDGGKFSSYTFGIVNRKLVFLFNAGDLAVSSDALALCVLDENGTLSRQEINDDRNVLVSVRPKLGAQLDDDSFLMFSELGKKHQFMRLVIQE